MKSGRNMNNTNVSRNLMPHNTVITSVLMDVYVVLKSVAKLMRIIIRFPCLSTAMMKHTRELFFE